MGFPNYPLISVSALVQGESLPLMQRVIFPVEVSPAPEPLVSAPRSSEAEARVRAFREMVTALKARKP
jgi:hypothetical protein